jgi:hypothetical protein
VAALLVQIAAKLYWPQAFDKALACPMAAKTALAVLANAKKCLALWFTASTKKKP